MATRKTNRTYEVIYKIVDDYPPEEQYVGAKEVREFLEKLDLEGLKLRSLKVREIFR